jgi:hypothetical protein
MYNLLAWTVSLNRGWERAEGVDFVSAAIISPIYKGNGGRMLREETFRSRSRGKGS